jgi:tRNA pseudouridine55 synthase
MQKPSVFSALKVDGKKMYEYAREGKDIPEVAARPVEVQEMELVEWLEPGSHEYVWPKEEADGAEREGAEKLLGIRQQDATTYSNNASRGRKRSRTPEDDQVQDAGEQPKRPRTESEPAMSGALPSTESHAEAVDDTTAQEPAGSSIETPLPSEGQPAETTSEPTSQTHPPAARLRMTVTSGFYVRSLCHDLGLACSSLGLMSSLIRSRQGDYTLNQNVVEFEDFDKGSAVWEPQIQKQLESFMETEGWEVEELEDDEAWEEKKGELMKRRKQEDRETSYRGGGRGKGKGNWKGKGNGSRHHYSKNMNGARD